ncbi:MAG: phosphoadenylyl-sulfate reductase [Gemmatimonadota bacterium]
MSAPREILNWAMHTYAPDRLALVSAFGPGSLVLIHVLAGLRARVPVIFIDTLYHFPETLELVERVRSRYDLDLQVVRPAPTQQAFEVLHGPWLWQRDLDRYQQLTKIEPFRHATSHCEAYITGRRRDQVTTRADLDVIEFGTPVRINPLASWTRAQVWTFIRVHDIPYNSLHDAGYTSVGDAPLTTPVYAGEHERAGRWRGLDRLECGIHNPPLSRSAS